MSYWHIKLPQKFLARLAGRGRNLAHVEPTTLICPALAHGGGNLRINVVYSSHCFTVKFQAGKHRRKMMIWDRGMARAFDDERFEFSKLLPKIIERLPKAQVNQTHEVRNYVYVTDLKRTDGRQYLTFFRLERASSGAAHDLELFVESAYLAADSNRLRRPNAIRFKLLAHKVLTNRAIHFPRR